ncbi:MAG: flagellar biosynthesis protein FliQ [Armatimonadetes bacterium]|nr:flagellar biosynthesis protein FliQ [Armatimonadota bacterium]
MLWIAKITYDDGFILGICSEALYLILLLSAPMLISALGVGLVISILQATTQVQEQTLSFVPKIVVTFLSVIICSTWIGGVLGAFAVKVFSYIPELLVK